MNNAAVESGVVAVLAEKPSVARDIAKVLRATTRGEGDLHGNGYVVTWAIGHLASLAKPHEIHPQWKIWRRETLPMLPEVWPLVVYEKTKDQFEVVRKILSSSRVGRVICATDAGREGELIFRYIYEAAGCSKPISRLWISSLTPEAIRKGFGAIKPGKDYEPLADAARGRSRADWLVTGLRGGVLSIEQGLDGSMAVAFQGRYLRYRMCPAAERPAIVPTSPAAPPPHQPAAQPRRRTRWMEGFDLQNAPPLWKAVESSGSRAES